MVRTGHSTSRTVDPPLFRFVRHLPARHYDAARGGDLRAGVGQTSGEETAAHATVVRMRYGTMAIVGTVLRLLRPVHLACGPIVPRVRPSGTLVRSLNDGVLHGERATWQRQDMAAQADGIERQVSRRLERYWACVVMAQAQARVVRGSTARA